MNKTPLSQCCLIVYVICFVSVCFWTYYADNCDAGDIQSYDDRSYFTGDALPGDIQAIGNPLEYAAGMIGIDLADFELPRGYEGGYTFACRFPVIDQVSNRPLYMKQWVEENSDKIIQRYKGSGIEVLDLALELLRGTGEFPDYQLHDMSQDLENLKTELAKSNFTPSFQDVLLRLAQSYLLANDLCEEGRKNLTSEDRSFFRENPGYYLVPDKKTMPPITGNIDTLFRFIEAARRVRFEYIFKASSLVASAIAQYVTLTRNYGLRDFFTDISNTDCNIKMAVRDSLKFIISGMGNDIHKEDADFLIDIGGNDSYLNNAGGCSSFDSPVSLCIDHEGDDSYNSPNSRYVQGFGFVGVGVLVDMAGNDSFKAEHFCQGAGILGVGILWNCGGDDRYMAQAFCQGAGMFGLGLMIEDGGEDFYSCSLLGQGGATTLGLGILYDTEGDDRYQLAIESGMDALGGMPGHGQGGALSFRNYPWDKKLTPYGGVGMLIDAAGNDRYRSKGWCDQGGSYIMSLGALVDIEGNDHYSANTGQGSGIHVTNAILVDRKGNDIYEGGFRCGGSGGDRSPGFLLDYEGNDIYKSNTSSYGTGCKPFCLSLFIDYSGDDSYICSTPGDKITFNNWDSFGGVWPESEPYLWPYAICMDLGGEDVYNVRLHRNNSERNSFGHGIHLDMDWKGGDVIGKQDAPLAPYHEFSLPEQVKNSPYTELVLALQEPDNFLRFQTIGLITQADPSVVPLLVSALKESGHRQFNRDILECIHIFLVQGKLHENQITSLLDLLNAKDEEVRITAAIDMGNWGCKTAVRSLIHSLESDASASVRRFALASLLKIGSSEHLDLVRKLCLTDPSEHGRRLAVQNLSKFSASKDNSLYPFFEKIVRTDPASGVRIAAIEAIAKTGNPGGISFLKNVAKEKDVYIQRAAGKALAELSDVDGIAILIESLKFPSIDAFYNYDRNVSNSISTYAGYDMNETDRYDMEKWQSWFKKNRNKISIKKNVNALHAFQTLEDSIQSLPEEQKISHYEKFVSKYHYSQQAKKRLAGLLNASAWNLVTSPVGTPSYDPQKGLKYALRAVELDSQPNYVDTLAEAYLALGNKKEASKICNEMLEKYPGEAMFREKLKRCK